ncbi:MAG TPA: energy transducer TonB, partial [Pyrinomonadaceae bacterium]
FAQDTENFACSKVFKTEASEYFENRVERQKFIARCEEKSRLDQIKEFGAPPVKILGGCQWSNDGCPVSLIKPAFPKLAKALKIGGRIPVRIIIDEEGKVIFSRVLGGHPLLKRAARKAACQSIFYPKTACGQKIKQSLIIVYNFVK